MGERVRKLEPYTLPPGWILQILFQYSLRSLGLVWITSGTTASPCTSTAGGSSSPLAVGSENSSETLPSRRTLKALFGRPMDVVSTNCCSSGCHSVMRGQVIGVPSRASVENSQVRNSLKTSSTSGDRANLSWGATSCAPSSLCPGIELLLSSRLLASRIYLAPDL